MSWRMEHPCADCPFNTSGAGLHLRKSLGAGRWRDIKTGLVRGESFTCHKTTEETGDGSNLMCAGAIAYQRKHGVSSNLQRVCERLEYFWARRAERAPSTPGTVSQKGEG